MDLNKAGTFAATTNHNYTTIPYHRATSFRVTNFTGKVVGIRRRYYSEVVDNFNDVDFTEWTGGIEYESSELEGTGAAKITATAHRPLTSEVVLDGAEVEFSVVTPSSDAYSIKFSVYDDVDRIGMDGAGYFTILESNSKSNTKYKVTIRLNPTTSTFDTFLQAEGEDKVSIDTDEDGQFGSANLANSIIAIEGDRHIVVDPIIYHKKVNHSVEHIGHGGNYVYPCNAETSEYEIINLGSDAMNYSDNTQTISISGFYSR
jgi:hypothetical protein